MQRLLVAVRLFFAVLLGQVPCDAAARLLDRDSAPRTGSARPAASPAADTPAEPTQARSEPPKASPAGRPAPHAQPARSDALTLLATLQREARLLDIVTEPLGDYSDEQIGAAARDVLRNCHLALERMFGLEPVLSLPEGSQTEVPAGADPGEIRVTGKVSGQPPYSGALVHRGWRASRCELPAWSGQDKSRLVIAAAEVEVS